MTSPVPPASATAVGARIPLTARQRRRARIAGALALPLLTIGLDVILSVVVFVGFWLVVVMLFSVFDDSPGTARLGTMAFVGIAAVPAVVGLCGAALLATTGFLLSWLVLRRASVRRPAATTWAGMGVCLVPQVALVSIAYSVATSVQSAAVTPENVGDLPWLVYTIAAAVTVVLSAIMGAFGWWWMAHALRGRVTPAVGAAATPAESPNSV
ncbi:hypothetical protein BH09ACT6_BH09ACT6_04450 [soil metagenome]